MTVDSLDLGPATGFTLVPTEHGWELAGQVDVSNGAAFGRALTEATGTLLMLWVRCDDLSFIDLAGLRTIADVVRRRPGLHLVLEAAPAAIARCWDLAGFDTGRARVQVVP
jgi:anti-anti-sigma regulatory factor